MTKTTNWGSSFLAIAILFAGVGAIAGGVGLAFQLMLDPDATLWFNQYLPQQVRIPIKSRQSLKTLAELRASITQAGLVPGDTLELSATIPDLLIPVYQQRPNCQLKCNFLSELRVYRPVEPPRSWGKDQPYYQLVSQLPISPLEEAFVLSPEVAAKTTEPLSNRSLNLTEVSLINPPMRQEGVWLELAGRLSTSDRTTIYGKIIYYNPTETHLTEMLDWTSPTGDKPTWRQVTGDEKPELIINQTIGFEPTFKIYQIQPRPFVPAPLELEEITLATPALSNISYRNALILAKGGLWTPALELIQSQTNSPDWSTPAQNQLNFIQLHAEFTQIQADKTWASPSQQILAHLIDGRWQAALNVFAASAQNRREIATLLKSDSGNLWKRVEAALQVTPKQPEIRVWGALIRGTQDGKAGAYAWLNKQPPLDKTVAIPAFDKLLTQLEYALSNQTTSPVQLIASVKPIFVPPQPTQWWKPNPKTADLSLDAGQTWYQIQITGYAENQRWQIAPFPELYPEKFWQKLGLDIDSQVQLSIQTAPNQQQALIVTVQALQFKNGILQALASGEDISNNLTNPADFLDAVAIAAPSLKWLNPDHQTLAELSQSHPDWVATILPKLWQELRTAGEVSPDIPEPTVERLQSPVELIDTVMGNWSIQYLDLTDAPQNKSLENHQPEILLTLSPEALTGLSSLIPNPLASPKTLIFDAKGQVIYSEFTTAKANSLRGIIDLGNNQSPGLIVANSNTYKLLRWSNSQKKFE